jgi:hypothetical protein
MKLQFAPVQLKAGNGVNFIVKKTDLPLMILLYMIRPTATPPQFHPASAWPSASLPRARRTSVLDCSPTPLAAGTARTPWPDCDWIFFLLQCFNLCFDPTAMDASIFLLASGRPSACASDSIFSQSLSHFSRSSSILKNLTFMTRFGLNIENLNNQ